MNDAELRAALRTLERVTAPPRFTSETLRKLLAEVAPRPRWRLVAATAMTVMLVAGTYAASVHRARNERMAMIRAKRQRIESELRDVKALAREVHPVVVLENAQTRVIIDDQANRAVLANHYF